VDGLPRILSVVAEKGFRDEEFAIPYGILNSAGHTVDVASTSAGEAIGKLGMRVKPNLTLTQADSGHYAAVLVSGGPTTPVYIWPNEHIHKLLLRVYEKGGVVAAICLAPAVLARVGLLKGKKATVFRTPDSIREMNDGGCTLLSDHVVVEGRIVTADGPDAARQFGEAVLKLLS
jgi:protease I